METRHVVRCLRSNPSASISGIARRQNQQPCFLLRGQHTGDCYQRSVSIPSSQRYFNTSDPSQSSSGSRQQPGQSAETKTENPTTTKSSSSNPAPAGGKPSPRSNERKLGEVTDILNQLGMRKPAAPKRTPGLESLFADGPMSSVKSPSIAQLSERVRNSLSRPSQDPFTPPKVDLRLGPSLGRTVTVDQGRGFDVTRAVRTMEGMCARNKVRVQEREQKFHLRRGQKRKDLRSQRWRKLFNASFQKTLLRCHRMRQQGW